MLSYIYRHQEAARFVAYRYTSLSARGRHGPGVVFMALGVVGWAGGVKNEVTA